MPPRRREASRNSLVRRPTRDTADHHQLGDFHDNRFRSDLSPAHGKRIHFRCGGKSREPSWILGGNEQFDRSADHLSQGMEPKSEWLGLIRGIEAIIGFGLLTASVSWLLSIYPVLETRRSLAQRASLLHNAEVENGIDLIRDGNDQVQNWLIGLAGELASLRNQMAQFPITFFFYVGEPKTALAGALPYLNQLAERAVAAESAVLKLAGTTLGGAVSDFSMSLAKEFLRMHTAETTVILRRYAREHLTDMME